MAAVLPFARKDFQMVTPPGSTVSGRKEITKEFRTEINEIVTKKTIEKLNETKAGSSEKKAKIDKPIKKKRERSKSIKSKMKRGIYNRDANYQERLLFMQAAACQ